MAAALTSQPVLSERTDVHKSCKSLESLLNVLNDYCEAAGAVVLLQKKLAKALKETASQKATGELASNALSCSAALFEALSDIDTKYAKIADKEYDGISGEVKKWFKRLAKEEKAHDDRIKAADTKIKQAGQAYEKKSKKNAQYAGEEHARYIQLITALGPEVSQEKYDHALLVTQRHTTTTYSVAACIARVADAEWMKSCESVRRFSPHIGRLSEWRAYCEGGWTGPIPSDLPDIDDENAQATQQPTQMNNLPPPRQIDTSTSRESANNQQPSPIAPSTPTPADREPGPPVVQVVPQTQRSPRPPATAPSSQDAPRASAAPPSSFEPPRPLYDPNTGSVRSLSAFPSPPTHFPVPTARQQQASSQSSSTSHTSLPRARFTESPLPSPSTENPPSRQDTGPEGQRIADAQTQASRSPQAATSSSEAGKDVETSQEIPGKRPLSDRGQGSLPTPTTSTYQGREGVSPRRTDVDDFGVLRSKSPSTPSSKAAPSLERQDTAGSTGSVVAAMRNRYSMTVGSTTPPAKEPIRLQTNVADLATRYKGPDEPTSPRLNRAASPTFSRPLPMQPLDITAQARAAEAAFRTPTTEPASPLMGAGNRAESRPMSTAGELTSREPASPARRQPESSQRGASMQQGPDARKTLDMQEKEQQLAQREREIEARARALERERQELASTQRGQLAASPQEQLVNSQRELLASSGRYLDDSRGPVDNSRARPEDADGWGGMAPRQRRASTASPYPAAQSQYPHTPVSARPMSSYSTTHLIPPGGSRDEGRGEDYRHGGSSEEYGRSSSAVPYPRSPDDRTRTMNEYSRSSSDAPFPRSSNDYSRPSTGDHSRPSTADYARPSFTDQQSYSSIPAAHRAPVSNTLRPEKPKGWIRRLSMPVVGRSSSSQSLTKLLDGGKRGGEMAGSPKLLDGRRGELGAVAEDGVLGGERRSYDVPGNRSWTNLARR
ncbi:hypothetical protein BD626DRAFT_567927 [Schizophyllum amplum]|uniref:Uncharacterized protein n=1 Tax=Schizophyllum amplum TaxID=97359 RepID=A0A550CJV5_9AGAR|nr:hypothetical protein BD626DRAFT_567927 [Auriculariopsis ampla]